MEKIVVYGLGKYFELNREYLYSNYEIMDYFDKERRGLIYGKKIRSAKEVKYSEWPIVIMIENMYLLLDAARYLHKEMHIEPDNIILGMNVARNGGIKEKEIESIKYINNGNIIVSIKGFVCELNSADEYYDVYDVLIHEDYAYYINNGKKDIVFDVGMNIGDSAHYFLGMQNVEKVYSFEPFYETYRRGMDYLNKDIRNNKNKFEGYAFGLSDKDEVRTIEYNGGMTIGMSTNPSFQKKAEDYYVKKGMISIDSNRKEEIEVKSASKVISEIIKKHDNRNYVIKLDCEGEEYSIIANLKKTGILKKISLIMMEWHYQGSQKLIDDLIECGFSYCRFDKSDRLGIIYAYR